MKFRTIADLRRHYVEFGGFSGGWNTLLETFKEFQACYPYVGHGPKMAVSSPVSKDCWLIAQMDGLAVEKEIGGGMVVLVIEDWEALERHVLRDSLRERLLVMITGNLFGDDYSKAVKFSGRSDGRIRRSKVAVPVGQAYWYPTQDQLDSVS